MLADAFQRSHQFRFEAGVLPCPKPSLVSGLDVLRTPAFLSAHKCDPVDKAEMIWRVRRNARPRKTVLLRPSLYITPHVTFLNRLCRERDVVHFKHDGSHVEGSPSERDAALALNSIEPHDG